MLGLPGGQSITALVGLGVVIGGGVMIWNGGTKRFMEDQDVSGADTRVRRLNARTGQIGFIAKGIAFGVLGILLGIAALTFDPRRANGLDSALRHCGISPTGCSC